MRRIDKILVMTLSKFILSLGALAILSSCSNKNGSDTTEPAAEIDNSEIEKDFMIDRLNEKLFNAIPSDVRDLEGHFIDKVTRFDKVYVETRIDPPQGGPFEQTIYLQYTLFEYEKFLTDYPREFREVYMEHLLLLIAGLELEVNREEWKPFLNSAANLTFRYRLEPAGEIATIRFKNNYFRFTHQPTESEYTEAAAKLAKKSYAAYYFESIK